MLRRLTMRAHSRAELAQALAKRNVPGEVAERVLNRMEQVGLVDDDAFAASWVASRQQRRHLSRRALRAELGRKGLDREVIGEAVNEVDDEDEYTAAVSLARSKLRSYARLEPHVRRRRMAGVLARRGFDASITARVLEEVLGEATTDPEG
ncbi:regulatory protein RecX [Enemella sp. A6]|uniref:regulatory protein RecX n=1 Tax=Enemella sp. A6 TaxID=3440152 RepID=UPI003EB93D6A